MEERKGFLDYAAQVLLIFGFSMVCMLVFVSLFGESAKEISQLFTLGREGVSVKVMLEFLLLSVIIVALRYFFFTDQFLKKMTVLFRTIWMVFTILMVISLFIAIFDWFPVTMWQPWVMFLVCFFVCFGCSVAVTVLKTKQENKRLAEGLARLKQQWEEEHESE